MKTQQSEILNALIKGKKLTALDCFELTGSLRMSAKAFDIEKKYNIFLEKKTLKGKTRYGTSYSCTQYSMSKKDAAKVKEMLKKKRQIV